LFKAGYIEAWGRGIAKILLGCQKAKLPEPIIEESFGGLQITFFKSKEKSKGKSKGKSKDIILDAIKTNPSVTTTGLIEATGLTAGGVEKNIRILKKQGAIQRMGSRKSGYWKLTEGN
jgi:ATP-dependent DNA helicase RecG